MASTFPTFPSRSHSHSHTHTHPYRGRCMCVGVLLAEQYLLCTHNTHHHRECILTNCNNVCTQGRNTSSTNVLHTFKSFTRTLYVHTVQCTVYKCTVCTVCREYTRAVHADHVLLFTAASFTFLPVVRMTSVFLLKTCSFSRRVRHLHVSSSMACFMSFLAFLFHFRAIIGTFLVTLFVPPNPFILSLVTIGAHCFHLFPCPRINPHGSLKTP